MHRFRKKPSSPTIPLNSPSPASLSPIVDHIKKELTTFYPRVKDNRALVASSSAVALSIASPLCEPTNPGFGEPGSSKESVWRTAYGTARIAIEVAKESSDMFLPLKAVVGALSVLIKHYDQTIANADQIRDIEERMGLLGGLLTSPVGDGDIEEKARRMVLKKRLSRIVAELRPLSEQHGLSKFLNNGDHANNLNGFVQDIATAITDYQTSIQQSIHADTKRIDENTKNIIETAELELLGNLGPVRSAGYQAGHHDTCLRGTRESVLESIMRWGEDPQEKHVFWLNGMAGTGKSTIAQTFSEIVAKSG